MTKRITEFSQSGYSYKVLRRSPVRDRDIWFECAVTKRPEVDGKPYGLGLHSIVLFERRKILELARNVQ